MLVDVASNMWPGSAFHASITRLEKKCFLISNLALGFSSFSVTGAIQVLRNADGGGCV